jgi:hypothetical protein
MGKKDDEQLRETVLAELERRRKAAREQEDRSVEHPTREGEEALIPEAPLRRCGAR